MENPSQFKPRIFLPNFEQQSKTKFEDGVLKIPFHEFSKESLVEMCRKAFADVSRLLESNECLTAMVKNLTESLTEKTDRIAVHEDTILNLHSEIHELEERLNPILNNQKD